MNKYELAVILRDQPEEELAALKDKIKAVITHSVDEEIWGVKDLAYPIAKNSKGYYTIFRFSSDGSNNKEIEAKLNIESEVLRYLLIRDESEKYIAKNKAKEERKKARPPKPAEPVRRPREERKPKEA